MPEPKDPVATYSFALELQSVTEAVFRDASGFSTENEVIEYKQQSKDGKTIYHKIPGNLKWSNITLKRGITDNLSLWEWRKKIVDGQVETQRKDGSIVGYSADGKEVVRYNFRRGWPCKWDSGEMNAGSNEVIIETLEIAHEGFERVK